MKITKVLINNFRLLKEFEVNFEDDLSLVIGKNNTGKTSFLAVLERFLISNQNKFSFEDINLTAQKTFKENFQQNEFDESYNFGIQLKLYINYEKTDDLSNISKLMLNLNPDDNIVVIGFAYSITYEEIQRLKIDFYSYKEDYDDDKKDILFFLKENHKRYFKIRERALEYDNEDNFIKIDDKSLIDRIINFKRIRAKRDVINTDGTQNRTDQTLSRKSSRYYKNISNPDNEPDSIKKLQKQLSRTDKDLDDVYTGLFENLIEKVKRFGGTQKGESAIEIKSALEGKDILKNNTSVTYNQDGNSLPEDYYGLGYLNLISIIFDIEVTINEFKKSPMTRKNHLISTCFLLKSQKPIHIPKCNTSLSITLKNYLKKKVGNRKMGF